MNLSHGVFEKFVHPHSTQISTVTGYAKSGRFTFNQAAVKQFNLNNYKHCNIYFEKKTKRIGFIFLGEPSNGSVKVKNYNNTLSVAGMSFCTFYDIDLNIIKRHEITKQGDMLIINSNIKIGN